MTIQPLRPTRVIDMDGTLMECGIYYDQCLVEGGKLLAARTGITPEQAEELIRGLDLLAVHTPGHAWGRDRFPNSFRAAAYAACVTMNIAEPWNDVAAALWTVGNSVFDAEYALFDGVREKLRQDKAAGWQLILYTKGDQEVQELKIEKQQLAQYFDAMYIVPAKNADVLRKIIGERSVDIAVSWMIGDSKKDDIAPAQALGLNTALVDPGNHNWSYNDHDIDPPTLHVRSISEVPTELGAFEFGQRRRSVAA